LFGFIGLFDTVCDYTLQFTITHTHARTHALVFAVTSLLVVDRQRSPTADVWHGPHGKHRSSVAESLLRWRLFGFPYLPWKHACLRSYCLATAAVYLVISRSLPNSGSTCHNIKMNIRQIVDSVGSECELFCLKHEIC
jgi:hypothetical protein